MEDKDKKSKKIFRKEWNNDILVCAIVHKPKKELMNQQQHWILLQQKRFTTIERELQKSGTTIFFNDS